MMDPETFVTAGGYVQREYGFTGYRMEAATERRGSGIFNVRASDGSEFRIMADRYGNAATIPDSGAPAAITEFFENAERI